MIEQIYELFVNNYTFKVVTLGCSLLGIICAVIGSFAVLKKESLLGDGISHAALAGVCLSFLIFKKREIPYLLLGALIIGIFCIFLIHHIQVNSKVKFDSSIALTLSTFFGLGLVLLTYLNRIPGAKKAGISNFIFGQASTLISKDIYLISGVGILILIFVLVFWSEIKISIFDKEYAQTIGINSSKIHLLVSILIVLTVIIGIQIAGVILITAMLVSPFVAARQWSDKLNIVVILAAIFGGISGFVGTSISTVDAKLPTGPIIVMCLSFFAVFSILFSPKRGLIGRYIKLRKAHKDIKEKYKGGSK